MEASFINRRSLLVLLLFLQLTIGQNIGGIPAIIPGANWPALQPNNLSPIIDALRAGGFSVAGLLLRGLSNFIPAYATLMIPTNAAIASMASFNSSNSVNIPSILLYHAVLRVLPFELLTEFPVGQPLPTMLVNNPVRITSNSPSNFTVNGIRIVRPNLCGNISQFAAGVTVPITCHGIDGILDPTASLAASPTVAPVRAPTLSPQGSFVMPPSGPPPEAQIVIPGSAIAPGAGPVAVTVAPAGALAPGPSAAATLRHGAATLASLLVFLCIF